MQVKPITSKVIEERKSINPSYNLLDLLYFSFNILPHLAIISRWNILIKSLKLSSTVLGWLNRPAEPRSTTWLNYGPPPDGTRVHHLGEPPSCAASFSDYLWNGL